MRQNHVVSLLQTGYTTVQAVYNIDDLEGSFSKRYTFKVLNDMNVKVGDICVVQTSGYSLVRIINVHDEPNINLDSEFDYKWVVDKVNLERYKNIITVEKEMLKQLNAIEAKKRRQEVLEGLKGLHSDELTKLKHDMGDIK